jgi:hypothetical protein
MTEKLYKLKSVWFTIYTGDTRRGEACVPYAVVVKSEGRRILINSNETKGKAIDMAMAKAAKLEKFLGKVLYKCNMQNFEQKKKRN